MCGNLEISNFDVWTETGNSINYMCQSVYGAGACMGTQPGNGPYNRTTKVQAMDPA